MISTFMGSQGVEGVTVAMTDRRVYSYKTDPDSTDLWSLEKEHDNFPDVMEKPIELLLIHTTDRQKMLDYFQLSKENPVALLNSTLINF